MKKNILIISYVYPPINIVGGLRAHAIAKKLDTSKYNVTLITSKPSKDYNNQVEIISSPHDTNIQLIQIGSYIGEANSQNKDKKTKIIKPLIYKVGKKFIYPDKGMIWYHDVKRYLGHHKSIIKNSDIVLSTSPIVSSHNIARYIKKENPKIKWVADFRDFYYTENIEYNKSLKSLLHRNLERKFIEEADSLIFVTETMLLAYKNRYIKHADKMKSIYNGFDKDHISHASDSLLDKKLSFFYAGSFYNGLRSPEPLLKVLDKAFQNGILSKDEVIIRIAGNIDEEMKADIAQYECSDCIDYLGFISREQALHYMCSSTFLWLIVANIKSHYQTVPAKIFEYIGARRPIINFSPSISEASKIIKENDLGYNFDTLNFDVEDTYSVLKDIIAKYKEGEFNEPLNDHALDKFSWDSQILLFENIL